jgi:hypothetical protein
MGRTGERQWEIQYRSTQKGAEKHGQKYTNKRALARLVPDFYTSLMPGASRAEIYFIVAMMILIFVICAVSLYYFFVTYKKEMREKRRREEQKKNGGTTS